MEKHIVDTFSSDGNLVLSNVLDKIDVMKYVLVFAVKVRTSKATNTGTFKIYILLIYKKGLLFFVYINVTHP